MDIAGLRHPLLWGAFAATLMLSPAVADDHEHHQHHQHHDHAPAAAKPVTGEAVRVNLSDTPLVDQLGRKVRLKSDVVGERVVVIDFIYTNCTAICPVNSALFSQVQTKLGDRMGREVSLISVTVDPVRDTPARLKEYAARYGAGPGWSWLTGAKPQVDEVLQAFGAYTPNFENHPPLILVGDPKTGKWIRFYGFPGPEQIAAAVSDMVVARAKSGSAG